MTTASRLRCVRRVATLVAGAAILTLPSRARAQAPVPLHFSVGAGVALPSGSNPHELDTGYHLQAALEAGPMLLPIALRAELLFDHFGFSYTPGPTPVSGNERMVAGTLNALLLLRTHTGVTPYLIAGGGLYDHHDSANNGLSGTDIGVNGGAGLRIAPLHAFVEARAHIVKHAPNYIPIGIGLVF